MTTVRHRQSLDTFNKLVDEFILEYTTVSNGNLSFIKLIDYYINDIKFSEYKKSFKDYVYTRHYYDRRNYINLYVKINILKNSNLQIKFRVGHNLISLFHVYVRNDYFIPYIHTIELVFDMSNENKLHKLSKDFYKEYKVKPIFIEETDMLVDIIDVILNYL